MEKQVLTYKCRNVTILAKGGNMELITTKEVARLLVVSDEQVRRLVHRHGLPCYQLSPRVLRFKEEEVLQWVKKTRSCI